jgi:transcriptional regulator with GAF, ATPase, and Fis domain
MKPILVGVFGPLQGSSLELNEDETSIGRDTANQLCIPDSLLSRRHCLIKKDGESFRIIDLDSRNGILVNTIPVKDRVLQHGDQIEIGDSLFLFLVQDEQKQTPSRGAQLDAGAIVPHSTTTLRMDEALYLKPEKLRALDVQRDRSSNDLALLLKISAAIHSLQNAKELQARLFELILEVLPAERGALLLGRLSSGKFETIRSFYKTRTETEGLLISRTIVDSVYDENIAILANDIRQDPTYSEVESLIASKVQSILCVPLTVFEKKLGVIYLDTRNAKTKFDQDHLQLLTAIAAIAAIGLNNAGWIEWLEEENLRLKQEILIEHNMIGESGLMQKIYQLIGKVAATDSTVLIFGESGTGKELAARAIHNNSVRSKKPFVAINCATLSDTLLESELFGHEKGAFTGAIAQTKGKFEVAHGGTIFLDEVSEIPLSLQAKLLRVLQEREFERVGGTRPIQVDIRLIAATNKNLEELIQEDKFRQDLFFRINVIGVKMPSLRERREDIPLLANYFLAKFSKKFHRRFKGISPDARKSLMNYEWPGNIRELENAMERAIVLSPGEILTLEDLPETLIVADDAEDIDPANFHHLVKENKKRLIMNAIKQSSGSHNDAAKLLGLHPTYLSRLIRSLNLKEDLKI